MQQVNVLLRPSPAPGQAIADGFRNVMATETLDFFHEDGRPIGSIMLSGLGVETPHREQLWGRRPTPGGT